MLFSWVSLLGVLLASCLSQQAHASSCRALKSLQLQNTTIISATHISASNNVSAIGTCQDFASVSTSICRVEFMVNTTATSAIHAEAWLPDVWYGRFLAVGNGGLGGCIDYRNLDYGASLHFATVASNNGHDGIDGKVFWNEIEVINDFAHRAIHVQTIIGKQIVDAYYGSPHHHSYFLGCSTGGRQGTQAALKYPEDFDGIVAGAPGTDWNHLLGWAGMLARYVGAPHANTSATFIPSRLWDIIAAEILRQCDALDGVEDGIITEPDACDFHPEAIACPQDTTKMPNDCLSGPQIAVLRKIYQPLYDTEGELIYPRYDPGTEAERNVQALMDGSVNAYTAGWYRYTIFNDSSYDFSNFSVRDVMVANRIDPGGISTFNGNISKFKNKGGKFITYHGRRDELVPSGNSKRVYDLISRALGMPSLDTFYRLFLIPGMTHCTGGPGAGNFGQLGIPSNVANASSHNVLLAMVDWVEEGVDPDTIVGTDSEGKHRVHCRYPQRSVWNGEDFVCKLGSAVSFLDSSTG